MNEDRSKLSITLPDDIWSALNQAADKEGQGLDDIIETILKRWQKTFQKKKHQEPAYAPMDAFLTEGRSPLREPTTQMDSKPDMVSEKPLAFPTINRKTKLSALDGLLAEV